MIITIRCIKKYGKRRAGFAPAVLIAVGGNSGCSMHLLIRTLNTYHYNGNGRAEFASAGSPCLKKRDAPLNMLLNRYLNLYLTAPCLKNQPYKRLIFSNSFFELSRR